jgi:hypothetical protein
MNIKTHLKNTSMISVVLVVMNLLALFSLPYFYYQLLRLFMFTGALYSAFVVYSLHATLPSISKIFTFFGVKETIGILLVISFLWNPIIPIFLSKGMWNILNLVAAFVFAVIGPNSKQIGLFL